MVCSGQSFSSERSRSRDDQARGPDRQLQAPAAQARVPDGQARTPDGEVGAPDWKLRVKTRAPDGPVPVDNIGWMTLGESMQVLYIAHCDPDSQQLWASAMTLGHSKSIANIDYLDFEGDSALCKSVRSGLRTTGGTFAMDCFMCARVGGIVAVGIGNNTKNRKRSSRIAAAVCYDLQEKTRVAEFLHYPGLQSLIKQVRSCYEFEVR